MDFQGAKQYALDRLSSELSSDLFYHHVEHTIDVCNAIEGIAMEEGIVGNDLILLRTAGIFHDIGFIEQYANNEPVAVQIAQKVLPGYDYSDSEINIISELILATRVPQEPKTHLEEIICDADLDYLGRDDFDAISHSLMKEWIAYGLVDTEEEFNEKQLSFFNAHHYFTDTAKRNRKVLKEKHFAAIIKLSDK
ncbi:MAG: hypothetical protein ACJAT1_000188 [Marivirga sp.]|jgi:uncharacterized protein